MPNPAYLLTGLWFFLLGCAMGSFYNVLVDRLPAGESVIRGRSACTACGTRLRWSDLIPVWSFLALKGRCRYCGQKLSARYLVSELLTGGLFLLSFLRFARHGGVPLLLTELTLWSLLFVVGFMDWKEGVIMDSVLLIFTAAGVAARLCGGTPVREIVFGAAVGFALYGAVYLAARLLYGREGFGAGDVLFLTAIGTFLGPVQTLVCGVLAFYFCLLWIAVLWLKKKKALRDMEMPFAPPICLSAGVMLLFGSSVTGFLARLMGFLP